MLLNYNYTLIDDMLHNYNYTLVDDMLLNIMRVTKNLLMSSVIQVFIQDYK